MDDEKLTRYLETILHNERYNNTVRWEKNGDKVSRKAFSIEDDQSISQDSDYKFRLKSKNFDLLNALYSKIKVKKQKNLFIQKLKSEQDAAFLLYDASSLSLLFLIRIQGFKISIEHYFDKFSTSVRQFVILMTLNKYLLYEHRKLNEEELDLLEDKLRSIRDKVSKAVDKTSVETYGKYYKEGQTTLNKMLNTISKVKYNRLSTELLEGVNFEINQDRETLQNNFNSLGFNKTLGESLDFIELQFMNSTDNFEYKSCADHLRTFTAALIKEIALKVSKINGESLANKKPHQYLKDKRFFNGSKEADFLQSFQNYLSSSSVHKLNSEREVVRTAKNIAIEFALLLSQRLDEYNAQQTSVPK